MIDSRQGAKWIWLPGFTDYDDILPGRFVLFRKNINLDNVAESACLLNISADTRYRLYINGKSVAFGPCKSYPSRWYYETVDIQPFLRSGTNTICAKVLRFFPNQIGSSSLTKTASPGFILWGSIFGDSLITDESWQCAQDDSIELQPRSRWNYILGPPFLSLDENVNTALVNPHWQDDQTSLPSWSSAIDICPSVKMMPALQPWKLYPRPIPQLPEVARKFQSVSKTTGSLDSGAWTEMIRGVQPLRIEANETVEVDLDSGLLTTAFFELELLGGAGTVITILYSEGYETDLQTDRAPFPLPRHKGDRTDSHNGRLYGTEDKVIISAADGECTKYEPFWFRTFRYTQLKIVTGSVAISVQNATYRETHYPLDITTQVDLDQKTKRVYDMCLNTLRNCMHETYEDCPFYEQNQFAMDARLQILFTYQLSRDDRLARKTIHEFHASRRDDGLLETNFPVSFRALNIPQFSLYWIFMLHDHMMYFGDVALIRRYLPTADGVLSYFDNLLNSDGLVGAFEPESWGFVDWVKEWQGKDGIRSMAVPPIYTETGVATYNSLIYSWTLTTAADLCDYVNRQDTAAEYRLRANSLNAAVLKHCYNGTFFTDGPGTESICEHSQIFAILSGAILGPAARVLLESTLESPIESMPRCSLALKHYIFRALEKTDLYERYYTRMMEPWQKMIDDNLTTCPETEVNPRSDCHGWSADPIYEIVAVLYGVRPRKPGFEGKLEELEPLRNLLQQGHIVYKLPKAETKMQWEVNGTVKITAI